ncbi:MAG: hypothetical protein J3Q66DRAFT_409106, partial [Benniella sp.]
LRGCIKGGVTLPILHNARFLECILDQLSQVICALAQNLHKTTGLNISNKFMIIVIALDQRVDTIADARQGSARKSIDTSLDSLHDPIVLLAPGTSILELPEDTLTKLALEDQLEVAPVVHKVVLDIGKETLCFRKCDGILATTFSARHTGILMGIECLGGDLGKDVIENPIQLLLRWVAKHLHTRVSDALALGLTRVADRVLLGLDLCAAHNCESTNKDGERVEEGELHDVRERLESGV